MALRLYLLESYGSKPFYNCVFNIPFLFLCTCIINPYLLHCLWRISLWININNILYWPSTMSSKKTMDFTLCILPIQLNLRRGNWLPHASRPLESGCQYLIAFSYIYKCSNDIQISTLRFGSILLLWPLYSS